MSSRISVRKICFVALFTAMNIVLSSFRIPVPGGGFYLNDIVICLAALVFDPVSALIVGGVGAFFGDLFFYPVGMLVSFVTRSVQAVAISLIAGGGKKNLPPVWRAAVALTVGALIMVAGYTFGRAFFYFNTDLNGFAGKGLAASVTKLPFQILQATVGAVVAPLLAYTTPLRRFLNHVPKE